MTADQHVAALVDALHGGNSQPNSQAIIAQFLENIIRQLPHDWSAWEVAENTFVERSELVAAITAYRGKLARTPQVESTRIYEVEGELQAELERWKKLANDAAESTTRQATCIHAVAQLLGPDVSATIDALPRAARSILAELRAAKEQAEQRLALCEALNMSQAKTIESHVTTRPLDEAAVVKLVSDTWHLSRSWSARSIARAICTTFHAAPLQPLDEKKVRTFVNDNWFKGTPEAFVQWLCQRFGVSSRPTLQPLVREKVREIIRRAYDENDTASSFLEEVTDAVMQCGVPQESGHGVLMPEDHIAALVKAGWLRIMDSGFSARTVLIDPRIAPTPNAPEGA